MSELDETYGLRNDVASDTDPMGVAPGDQLAGKGDVALHWVKGLVDHPAMAKKKAELALVIREEELKRAAKAARTDMRGAIDKGLAYKDEQTGAISLFPGEFNPIVASAAGKFGPKAQKLANEILGAYPTHTRVPGLSPQGQRRYDFLNGPESKEDPIPWMLEAQDDMKRLVAPGRSPQETAQAMLEGDPVHPRDALINEREDLIRLLETWGQATNAGPRTSSNAHRLNEHLALLRDFQSGYPVNPIRALAVLDPRVPGNLRPTQQISNLTRTVGVPGGFTLNSMSPNRFVGANPTHGTPSSELIHVARGQESRVRKAGPGQAGLDAVDPVALRGEANVAHPRIDKDIEKLYGVRDLVTQASVDPQTGMTKHRNVFLSNPSFGGAILTEPNIAVPIQGDLVPHVVTPNGKKSQSFTMAQLLADPEARKAIQDVGIENVGFRDKDGNKVSTSLDEWFRRMGWGRQ